MMRYLIVVVFVLSLCVHSTLHATTSNQAAIVTITEQDLFEQKKRLLKQEEALLMEKVRFQEKTTTSQITVIIISVLAGLVGGWISSLLMVRGWVKTRIKSELDENTKPLYDMLSLNQREADLKKHTRILILRESDTTSKLLVILRKLGFYSVKDAKYTHSDDIDWDDVDQVVLDNFEFGTLQSLVAQYPNKWLFAYREGDNYPERFDTVANANSGITLYPRLMELLIWKRAQ